MSDNIKANKKDISVIKKAFKNGNSGIGHIVSNDYHEFIVRKSERLASALYVITGFIEPDEPLRKRLRACALDLINRSIEKRGLSGAGIESFSARCLEIGNILSAAESCGLVSGMNASLISDEYGMLASFVREHETKIGERPQESFGSPFPSIGHNVARPLENKRRSYQTKDSLNRNSDRKSKILSLFNIKDRISIKDAVQGIEGCSEKTLQRDLLSMVASGVLIKEGERRWSTYRLTDKPENHGTQIPQAPFGSP